MSMNSSDDTLPPVPQLKLYMSDSVMDPAHRTAWQG